MQSLIFSSPLLDCLIKEGFEMVFYAFNLYSKKMLIFFFFFGGGGLFRLLVVTYKRLQEQWNWEEKKLGILQLTSYCSI